MSSVLCLTLNPSVDLFTHTPRVVPTDKLRCGPPQRGPGGGGLNVARVLQRLGLPVRAVFPAGGPAGRWLVDHLAGTGIQPACVPIAGETRENFTVMAQDSGEEYRFVLPGPTLSEQELQACLAAATDALPAGGWVVASGSLPPGAPSDTYARLASLARDRGARLVLDTAGAPLAQALAAGVAIVKPNRRELSELLGETLDTEQRCLEAAQRLVHNGQADTVALSMGADGAMLVTSDGAWAASALPITVASSVGAGDSFTAGLVAGLVQGLAPEAAFARAVAAGSAALLRPGTGLALAADIALLEPQVRVRRLS